MRYWYDCEFLEDGRTIELISIGIVAEDGREYYAVNANMPQERIRKHDWIVENVWPHLPHPAGSSERPEFRKLDMASTLVREKRQIANEVREFLLACDPGAVELWGYCSAYDHVLLAQLFGPMANMPTGLPWWTNDVQQLMYEHDIDGFKPVVNEREHHALADARWTKALWEWAQEAIAGVEL